MTARSLVFGSAGALLLTIVASPVNMTAQTAVPPTHTYTKDIAPIMQRSCQTCHRPGTNAPMSLLTYEDVRPWARAIKGKVTQRLMPPWHIDPTVGIQHYKGDRSLSQKEIDTIIAWVAAGAPQGDPRPFPQLAGVLQLEPVGGDHRGGAHVLGDELDRPELLRDRFLYGDQLAASRWALAAGGFSGVGLGAGAAVPAGHTDLAIAHLAEELGFVGALVYLAAIAAMAILLTLKFLYLR